MKVWCGGSKCLNREFDSLGRGVCTAESICIEVVIEKDGSLYFDCDGFKGED